MSPLAHAGDFALPALLIPLVFIVVYRLARGPLPPELPPRPPSEHRDRLGRT